MKMAILFFAAWAVCLVNAPRPAPAHQKAPDSAEQNAQTNKQPTKPLTLRANEKTAQNPANQKGPNVEADPDVHDIRVVSLPKRSTGDTVALVCTVILTVVGILGIFFAFQTVMAIKKQSDAMVKSERAWVMVDLEKVPIAEITDATLESFRVRCVCSNQGQTAARIIEKRCAVIAISGDDELPESPNLDIEIIDPVPHYLKANGDPWHRDWNITAKIVSSKNIQLFVVYGVVRYRHLFSDEIAQTTFGYCFSLVEWKLKRLIGHSKYNENK